MICTSDLDNCPDIREAVYLRTTPDDVRDEVRRAGSISEENEAKIFRGLFPSMREEALFWYQAGKGRGVVLCDGPEILYVPRTEIENALRGEGASNVQDAVATYDPVFQAVIVVVNEPRISFAIVGPGSPDPILQLAK